MCKHNWTFVGRMLSLGSECIWLLLVAYVCSQFSFLFEFVYLFLLPFSFISFDYFIFFFTKNIFGVHSTYKGTFLYCMSARVLAALIIFIIKYIYSKKNIGKSQEKIMEWILLNPQVYLGCIQYSVVILCVLVKCESINSIFFHFFYRCFLFVFL